MARGGTTGKDSDSAHLNEVSGALTEGKVVTGPRALIFNDQTLQLVSIPNIER